MISSDVTRERLTRQELGWLLAQEARSAATALREGVTQLKQPGLPVQIRQDEAPRVETSLDALDDAIGMLSLLESNRESAGRRGRIDVAALLYRLAPSARIAMAPGAGTEVFGDEDHLCRMLHVLLTQTGDPAAAAGAACPEVSIRREEDLVKISVELGPDRSATADVERRWLSRMAMRLGGRLELEGGVQSLLLPADAAVEQQEVVALRRELEQAQQLGETYARELAGMLAATASGTAPSTSPAAPSVGPPAQRLELLVATASALLRTVRSLLTGLRQDAAAAAESLGEGSELATNLAQRVSAASELLAELRRVADYPVREPRAEVDLVALGRQVVQEVRAGAAHRGVQLRTELPLSRRIQTGPGAFALLLRCLLEHAIAATPHGSHVLLCLEDTQGQVALVVEDGGPGVPDGCREDLLSNRIDPCGLGRPGGLCLLTATIIAEHLGHALTIGDGQGGRVQLRVTMES
jgi:two-component system OmpR family sensor kinase